MGAPMIVGPEILLPGAAAAGGVAWLRHRYRDIPELPTDIPLLDPRDLPEGNFALGLYQHTPATPAGWDWRTCRRVLMEAVWRPWAGGEQHLEILGTTNAGKTELGGLLAATVGERWPGWDLYVGDAMGGEDFTWVKDAGIGVVCRTDASISTMLREAVAEIKRRVEALGDMRVPKYDRQGVKRAVAPKNVRMLTRDQREELGLRPRLYVLDELPAALMREKQRAARLARKKDDESREKLWPIADFLMEFAATGRKVGMHLAALAQRGDADIIEGFTGNLFRARVLIGSTDATAEQMAHSGQAAVWRELAAEAGYEANGLERAMRPAGRALVSGLERRQAALVQVYHFDTDSRSPEWSDYEASRRAAAGAPSAGEPPSPGVSLASVPSRPRPAAARVLSPAPSRARARSEAPGGTLDAPVGDPSPAPPDDPPVRPRGRLGRLAARRVLAAGVWRFVAVPSVTPLDRPSGLRARTFEHYPDVCRACRATDQLEAAHRRARRLRGSDKLRNMMVLCSECHDAMTKAEEHMIAWRRRPWILARRLAVGGWSKRSRLPRSAWPYIGAAAFLLGLMTDRWQGWAFLLALGLTAGLFVAKVVVFSKIPAVGQLAIIRSNRTAADLLQRRARARAREGGSSFVDAQADASSAIEFGWATLKSGVVGASVAYLAGVYGPGLMAGFLF